MTVTVSKLQADIDALADETSERITVWLDSVSAWLVDKYGPAYVNDTTTNEVKVRGFGLSYIDLPYRAKEIKSVSSRDSSSYYLSESKRQVRSVGCAAFNGVFDVSYIPYDDRTRRDAAIYAAIESLALGAAGKTVAEEDGAVVEIKPAEISRAYVAMCTIMGD